MTQAAERPSTGTLRAGGSRPALTGGGPLGEQSGQHQRGEQWHGDRGELGDDREPRREPGGVQRTVEQVTDRVRAATSHPGDASAITPGLPKVLTAWVDVAEDMMKLQQRFFATILTAGNTDARTTTKV